MKWGLLAAVCGVLWTPATAWSADRTERLQLRRLDDTTIDAYLDRGRGTGGQALALLLQGSGCGSVAPPDAALNGMLQANAQLATLRIEKPGVSATSDEKACSAEYLAQNTIQARVMDVLSVVAHLRGQAPWWNRRLYVIGASEGATVAAISGALAAETRGVVLVNGSIGIPFREGWTEAVSAQAEKAGGQAAREQARAQADEAWKRARANPTTETVFGESNTLRWWASMIDLRPSNLLLQVSAPVLLFHAERDQMTPVRSARAVVEAFKKAGKENLTYRELPGADHGMGRREWNTIVPEVRTMILEQERRAEAAPKP